MTDQAIRSGRSDEAESFADLLHDARSIPPATFTRDESVDIPQLGTPSTVITIPEAAAALADEAFGTF